MLGQSLQCHIFTSSQQLWEGVVQGSTRQGRTGATMQCQQRLIQVFRNEPFWVCGAGDKRTGLLPGTSFTRWVWADLGKEGHWVRSLSAELRQSLKELTLGTVLTTLPSGRCPGREICVACFCVHHRYLATTSKCSQEARIQATI